MKKQQGFRWKKSIEQQRNKRNFTENLVSVGATVFFDVLCALFFLNSAKHMLEMVYADVEYSSVFHARVIWLCIFVSILLEATQYMKRLPAFSIRWGIFLSGAYATVRWMQNDDVWQKLRYGFFQVATVYLEEWNAYFGSSLHCPGGAKKFDGFFLEAVLITALVLLFWLAKVCRKMYVMAYLPILLLIAGLLIGNAPEEKGIFLLFAGILLACSQNVSLPDFVVSEEKKGKYLGTVQHFVWIISAGVIFLLYSIVPLAGRNPAEKTVTGYAGMAEDWILDTANRVSNWKIWLEMEDPGNVKKTIEGILGTTDYYYVQLNNSSPQLKNVPYLQVTTKEMPLDRIYLKGFYADTYKTGTWEKGLETFDLACAKAGFSSETVQEEMAVLDIEKLKQYYNINQLEDYYFGVTAKVLYYDPSTVKAYLPYFSEVTAEGISVEGEANYKKRLSQEAVSFTMWSYAGNYDSKLEIFEQGPAKKWESWYEQYVQEQHLIVPETLVRVKQVAAELKMEDLSRTSLGQIRSINEERLAKAYIVADWLGRNAVYSTQLPVLPWGEDPIEYFLGTSKKGYCTHFASAAVMLLREMKVPARYASGYMIERKDFIRGEEGYMAEVLGSHAHAWAEVYLNGIGWVPVEVTAGYSTLLPTSTPTISPAPMNQSTPTPMVTPTPTMAPEVVTEPENTGALTPIPVVSPVLTQTPSESGEADRQGTGINEGKMEGGRAEYQPKESPDSDGSKNRERRYLSKDAKTILIFILIVIGVCVAAFSRGRFADRILRLEKISERRIRKEMRQHGNRNAIKLLNRAIYRKIRVYRMVKKNCTDKEYESALKENFPVLWSQAWERYMEIVKAAEFSLRDFTDEEVEFCYKIYRDIIY